MKTILDGLALRWATFSFFIQMAFLSLISPNQVWAAVRDTFIENARHDR